MKKIFLLVPVAMTMVAFAACGVDDTAGTVATTDAGGTDSGGSDSGSDTSTAPIDSGSDAGPIFKPGDPITGLTPGSWTWVDIAGTKCRDGSSTGIGVNPSATGSKKVMIFLEGGGACFNAPTCGDNPATFGALQFPTFSGGEGLAGIFSRSDVSNVIADWNMVYVPYCTGDIHGGAAPDTALAGVGTEQFVGYTNITRDLERVEPTFADADQVLITGHSAGGFGAALNYVQTTRAFDKAPVALIDDSGPLFANPTLASCLETAQLALWNMSKTVVADCGSDCSDPGNALNQYWRHLAKTYPAAPITFLDSTADGVIPQYLGFGASNCTAYVEPTPEAYEAACLAMRTDVASDPNAGLFLFAGTDHTSLVAAYTTRTASAPDGGTVKLEDWVRGIVTGDVANVGP